MSSAVFSTSAAAGCLFVFGEEAVLEARSPIGNRKSAIGNFLAPASRLGIRPAPEMVPSGIPSLDALAGGLPRGCLTEICGPASSGRTTVLLAAVAAATRRGEFCAVVDASDTLDPQSVAAAGVELDRLLWVRCGEDSPWKNLSPQRHRDTEKTLFEIDSGRRIGTGNRKYAFSINNQQSTINNAPNRQSKILNRKFSDEHRLEQVLRATDLLLESGGFGLIILDLGNLPPKAARRIPLTTWFRFRRAVEHTPTILLAIEQQAIAGSCSSLLLRLGAAKRRENAAHGASRGSAVWQEEAPEERKTISDNEQSAVDNQCTHPPHAHLLTGLDINVELIHSRLARKPARSVQFASKTAWAG